MRSRGTREGRFGPGLTVVLAVLAALTALRGAAAEVRVWEEPTKIPTYLQREPELAPMFYHGRAYQGAEGRIYPYPFRDELTDERVRKTYRAAYLENEYIKVCVLPEVGGRVLYALDKTNGYNFVYRQHVIKPALIGMLGAWISGGIEWDLPHHHRARVFEPVDYHLEEHADGSKTIWVGELELRHRMRWIIGLTLRPGRSYLEARVRIFNRTPLVNSFLCFANVAVHANENYQVIFPPGTQYVTYHGKNAFTTWPLSHERFRGVDYTDGVDLSWWKNHPTPMSFFAWNYRRDFFGGYDHGRDAGIVCVANHHVVPGKKFFEWGPGFGPDSRAAMWNRILTEKDGPYLELMTGAYSDNQPDYSWIQPYEAKVFSWHWYPIRELDHMKAANLEGALSLELTADGRAGIAANATRRHRGARVVLAAGEGVLLDREVDIGPASPFSAAVELPDGVRRADLRLSLLSAGGESLVSYSPREEQKQERPRPVKPPGEPEEIETVEELYLTGQRIEQFHNPSREPYPYYREALERDPGNYRVNTSLGVLHLKRGMLDRAEERLRTAVRRVTRDYTSPRDGEALYCLGLVLKMKGKHEEAYDRLYRATWSHAFHSAAYYHLAQIDCLRGDFRRALGHLERSLATNRWNTKASALKCAVLRHLGRHAEAAELAAGVLEFDPLHPWAGYELYLAHAQDGSEKKARRALQNLTARLQADTVQSGLELATNYGNCGLWDEATGVLSRLVEEQGIDHPLVHYYLGYYSERKGEREPARRWFVRGALAPPDYCFPFRLESLQVLRLVTERNPSDHRAHYYLGNLLFHYEQREAAIEHWECSRDLNPHYAYVHRNLGMAYDSVQHDVERAMASYERAIETDAGDPRLFTELGRLYRKGDVPFRERLALFERHQDVVNLRDDALSLQVRFYVAVGKYDRAVELLKGHHFRRWEGGGDIRDVYVDAYLLRGRSRAAAGRHRDALRDYRRALEFPDNIEAARSYYGGRRTQIFYLMGTACEALGRAGQAEEYYRKAISAKGGGGSLAYYEAMARRKLGQEDRAGRMLRGLVEQGRNRLERTEGMDFFAKFGRRRSRQVQMAEARCLMGLGYLGLGRRQEAKDQFEKAVERDVDHVWAAAHLESLQ